MHILETACTLPSYYSLESHAVKFEALVVFCLHKLYAICCCILCVEVIILQCTLDLSVIKITATYEVHINSCWK